MFVQARSWSDSQRRWVLGRIHWMPHPWTTACGKTVVPKDWLVPQELPYWPDSTCKRCAG